MNEIFILRSELEKARKDINELTLQNQALLNENAALKEAQNQNRKLIKSLKKQITNQNNDVYPPADDLHGTEPIDKNLWNKYFTMSDKQFNPNDLLLLNPEYAKVMSKRGQTLLHKAAGIKDLDPAKVINLIKYSDVDVISKTNETPLYIAEKNGNQKIAQLLRQAGHKIGYYKFDFLVTN